MQIKLERVPKLTNVLDVTPYNGKQLVVATLDQIPGPDLATMCGLWQQHWPHPPHGDGTIAALYGHMLGHLAMLPCLVIYLVEGEIGSGKVVSTSVAAVMSPRGDYPGTNSWTLVAPVQIFNLATVDGQRRNGYASALVRAKAERVLPLLYAAILWQYSDDPDGDSLVLDKPPRAELGEKLTNSMILQALKHPEAVVRASSRVASHLAWMGGIVTSSRGLVVLSPSPAFMQPAAEILVSRSDGRISISHYVWELTGQQRRETHYGITLGGAAEDELWKLAYTNLLAPVATEYGCHITENGDEHHRHWSTGISPALAQVSLGAALKQAGVEDFSDLDSMIAAGPWDVRAQRAAALGETLRKQATRPTAIYALTQPLFLRSWGIRLTRDLLRAIDRYVLDETAETPLNMGVLQRYL